MEEKFNKGREVIADKLNLPTEVILDIPRILVTSNREITIENHKGIIAFDKDEIKVNSKIGAIKVQGREFEILYIGSSTITINGIFKSIVYEGASI